MGGQPPSTDAMYMQLQWQPLKSHRLQAKLTTFFKYHYGEVVINSKFQPAPKPPSPPPHPPPPTVSTGQLYSATYHLPASRTAKLFFPQTIAEWCCLLPEVVTAPLLETFWSWIYSPWLHGICSWLVLILLLIIHVIKEPSAVTVLIFFFCCYFHSGMESSSSDEDAIVPGM